MQLVANGPDLPAEVLAAQEENRLALFCGAGISIPAGLPSFKGLVDEVYERLGEEPSDTERVELCSARPRYDVVLGQLEGRLGQSQVRSRVAEILKKTPPDSKLRTHSAILELARDRTRRLRLVTTNFDKLFEEAEKGVPSTAAPLLPVPKPHKWDQLVHLHGRLDDGDPDRVPLVLTAADFGTAYLSEGWASRFVSELFRNFTVLFVGYAVDDPPMEYLIRAIAAERGQDEKLGPAFALAGHPSGKEAEERGRWPEKGITPILYEDSRCHALLHDTLVEWGKLWSGGSRSKLKLVTELAPHPPHSLPEHRRSQLLWAIADRSGAMAAELGRLRPPAPLCWLKILEKAGLLAVPRSSESDRGTALVGYQNTRECIPPLDAVNGGLATWLAEHIDEAELARWVVGKGGWLHPQFQNCIRSKLWEPGALPTPLRKVWLALTGSVRLQRGLDRQTGFRPEMSDAEWGPVFRAELRAALAPRLKLRPSWNLAGQGEESVASILSFDCELEGGLGLHAMLEVLKTRPDREAILADLAFDLTFLLREALDFQAALDGEPKHEPSRHRYGPHPPNTSWTMLVDLLRQSYEALRAGNANRADVLVNLWSSMPFSVFQRLALDAGRAVGQPRESPAWSLDPAALFPVEDLLARDDDELHRVLRERASNPEVLRAFWHQLGSPGAIQLPADLRGSECEDRMLREGLLNAWNQAAAKDPPRAIRLLARLRDAGDLNLDVWWYGLAGFRELGSGDGSRGELLDLLGSLPGDLLREERIVRAVADAIRSTAKDLPDALRPRLFAPWDAVFASALTIEVRGFDEPVGAAINHPVGVLAGALFDVLQSLRPKRGAGISGDVRSRLERIAGVEGPAAALGRVIIASQLRFLYELDPDWTRNSAISRFDWEDPEEARRAWRDFLCRPRLTPALWVELKPHFLDAFDHLDSLGESKQTLAAMLAPVCIEIENPLCESEARECLKKLAPRKRCWEVADGLCWKLKKADSGAGALWRDTIGPWLREAWPRELSLRDPPTSSRLAMAAVFAGDAFPEAVRCVRKIVGPVGELRPILREIEGRDLVATAPEACLELVAALTSNSPPLFFGPLRAFLDGLERVRPDLARDRRFRRLDDIAVERGL